MSYMTSPGLRLPAQSRPLSRSGMRSGTAAGGVEADNIFEDIGTWVSDTVGGIIDQVSENPWSVAPLLLALI